MKLHIISGFLGAGKTTYIKKMIPLLDGKKAVIENEFGDVSIDVLAFENDVYVKEINSGCICCSLSGDFQQGIKTIYTSLKPDHIIIEPSGVATLSDLLKVCKEIKEAFEDVEWGQVVTLVDCSGYFDYMESFGEFYLDQIRCSNRVVLSHDLSNHIAVAQDIKKHNPTILFIEDWFDDHVPSVKTVNEREEWERFIADHSRRLDMESYTLHLNDFKYDFDSQDFSDHLRSGTFGDIIRSKGVIRLKDSAALMNYVNGKLSMDTMTSDDSKVVLIGESIHRGVIDRYFQNRRLDD
ncbi:MAG: GTP-binding protein [Clostridiales bacterium]|nr:GTP-binding protein [Clostridiales bacterium]